MNDVNVRRRPNVTPKNTGWLTYHTGTPEAVGYISFGESIVTHTGVMIPIPRVMTGRNLVCERW